MSARLLTCLALTCLAGCAGVDTRPPATPDEAAARSQPPGADTGSRIAAAAESLVGSPYRFGGSGPDEFDCSGLVLYVHRGLGREVPRTADGQFAHARPIGRDQLRPGDLVFFRDGGAEVTHVGVYVGDDRFVHAPKNGRPVAYARLADEYYARSFAGAGRLH